MDKLRALSYFKRVVELQSFRATADEFSVPASSISRRIKDLEAQLGVELIQRSTRNVHATELGKLYYQHVSEVLENLAAADTLVSQSIHSPRGTLRICAPPGLAEILLIPILRAFRHQFPQILLDIDYSNELVMFGQDAVDIAIRGAPLSDDRLVAKQLSSSPYKLWGSKQLIEQLVQRFDTTSLSIEQLQQCPALMFRTSSGVAPWYAKQDSWQKLSVQPSLISNDRMTLMDALLNHEGLALIPQWLIPDQLLPEIAELKTETAISASQQPNMEIHILYQQTKYQIPSIKLCVDFIVQATQELS